MLKSVLPMLLLLTLITGIVYPLAITAVAYVAFPRQAHGTVMVDNGRIVGSSLIGQQFEDPKYFWPRLSATGSFPYNAASSSGSNLGPLSADLSKAMEARRQALQASDPANKDPIPIDLLTSSASGLDPHVSPEAAEYQAARVARIRGLDLTYVRSLIAAHTLGRQLGVLGQPVVNVLALNRALDRR